MIGGFYHFQVMLNDHDRVLEFYKIVQDFEKFLDVGKMQSCSRFIKQIECPSRVSFAQFSGEFNPLCLPARKSSSGLPKLDIAESHVHKRL